MATINRCLCNKCGKEITDKGWYFHHNEFIGYGSVHDTDYINLDLCSACFDDVIENMLETFEINPIKEGDV